MTKTNGLLKETNEMYAYLRRQHKREVEHIQKYYPAVAQFLTEFTEEFGRCVYRVSLKEMSDDKGSDVYVQPVPEADGEK